ncbi:MAG: protein kinase [Acidobacteriota bacterium]|nr:protein kinase [Acidobacteriota bacterium]
MALPPGTRIGVYEVTSQLGAGGMGEVYRARDSKLKREVALKVLPPDVANDRERMARFQREAEVLASLNHPNIAQIYGIEEGPAEAGRHIGADVASGFSRTTALVMELVEGEDLAERLRRGAIPLDEALPIAKQIAEALEAAHEQSIIHRDLKPANIKVRPDGTVKVLDFGLAKELEPGVGNRESGVGNTLANSPTITSPAMTMRGMILGTAAYMAPEQAKGKVVDKRADIWAFGCVLYEMLAGKRAFQGEDVSDTLAAVLRGDPDWALLPASLPPAWLSLIKRCLERDPRRRVSAMSTVRFVLEEPAVSSAPPTSPGPNAPTPSRAPLAAAAVVAVLASVAALYQWTTDPATASVMRFGYALPEGQALTVNRRMIALAPDGQQFVYIANNQLFVRRFSEFEALPVPATDVGTAMSAPTYSPDGEWIAFHSGSEFAVKRVSARGGAATTVCETGGPLTMEWDSTGILLGLGERGVGRCNPAGGALEVLVKPASADEMILGPQILPVGNTILFTVAKASDGGARRWDLAQTVVQSLVTGQRTTILEGAREARLLPTGHLVYMKDGVVYAAPADPATAQVRGDAVPLIDGVRRSTGGAAQITYAQNGTVAYVSGPSGGAGGLHEVAIADRNGVITKVPLAPGPYSQVRLSPDGLRVAIAIDSDRDASLLIYMLDGSRAPQRLTLQGQSRYPVWSANGQWLTFASERSGSAGIFRQKADGSGAVERLTTAAASEEHIPETWSPDDRVLLYSVRSRAPGPLPYALWMRASADGKSSPFGEVTSVEQIGAVFSPDGRWVAYASGKGENVGDPNRGVFVQPFPPTGAVYQAPKVFVDFHPIWAAGGKELVYSASGTAGQMAATKISADGGLAFGQPVRFPAAVTGDRLSPQVRAWDVLPDGRLIGITPASDGSPRRSFSEIRVVMNWFEELRQRVPVP